MSEKDNYKVVVLAHRDPDDLGCISVVIPFTIRKAITKFFEETIQITGSTLGMSMDQAKRIATIDEKDPDHYTARNGKRYIRRVEIRKV